MEVAQYTAQSFYVVYRQLPVEAQRAFRDLLDKEQLVDGYTNVDRISLSEPSLREIWESPEEDYWDELNAKQYPSQ